MKNRDIFHSIRRILRGKIRAYNPLFIRHRLSGLTVERFEPLSNFEVLRMNELQIEIETLMEESYKYL